MSSPNKVTVPHTLKEATDPAWLQNALAPIIGGAAIKSVEIVEVIRTVATKVRFRVQHERGSEALCLKGFLDVDAETSRGGSTMVIESDFYDQIAPQVPMRLADCVIKVVDRNAQQAAIIMRDLVDGGARMCNARTAFSIDDVAATLEQLAGLHSKSSLLGGAPWIKCRIAEMGAKPHLSAATIQELFDGPRSLGLPRETCNAENLLVALKELAQRDGRRPQVMVHGDCHAGNVFMSPLGPGFLDWQLIQRGSWVLDVAYHVNALLSVDVAEKEETHLLKHYLKVARSLGTVVPDFDVALSQYSEAVVYGYYLWAITRRVEPELTNIANNRLGMAVTRNNSYRRLGVF